MKGLNLVKKWRDTPAAAKSSVVFALSSFILKGISFLTTPVFTRILSPAHYGVVATYNSWMTIIEVFALLGLTSAGVFNVGLNDYREKRSEFISSILILCNLFTVSVFAILFAAQAIVGIDFLLPMNLLLVMFIHFIFSPATVFWVTRQRYEYKYKAAFCVSVGSAVVSQGLSAICVVLMTDANPAYLKIWSATIATLLFQVPIYCMLLIKGKKFADRHIWKSVLIFALPLLPHYLAQHVMLGSDRIMLSKLYSEAAAGIYSVVSNISVIATMIWSSVNASLVPYTFEKLNDKKYGDINRIVLPLLLAYSVICVGVTLVAPEIIMILAPKEYYSGVYAVPPIVSVAFLSALYNIYANVEFYHKKSGGIAVATIVSAVVNIALNLVLIPKFGFVGAAYTTLVSNIVLIFMHYCNYRRCQKERVYNDKLVFLLAAACLILCGLCNLLYINNIVRYAVIAVIAIGVIIKHKAIIALIKSLKSR